MDANLRARLERINTALNKIEDGWPSRAPKDSSPKLLSIVFAPERIPTKHKRVITEHSERLARGLPEFPGAKLLEIYKKPVAKKVTKAGAKKQWTCRVRPLVQGWGDVKECTWQ